VNNFFKKSVAEVLPCAYYGYMKLITTTIKLPKDLIQFADKRAKEIAAEDGDGRPNRSKLFRRLLDDEKARMEQANKGNGHK
jgi:hypothetical protein